MMTDQRLMFLHVFLDHLDKDSSSCMLKAGSTIVSRFLRLEAAPYLHSYRYMQNNLIAGS